MLGRGLCYQHCYVLRKQCVKLHVADAILRHAAASARFLAPQPASSRNSQSQLSSGTQKIKFLDVPGEIADRVADELLELGAMSAGYACNPLQVLRLGGYSPVCKILSNAMKICQAESPSIPQGGGIPGTWPR